MPKKSLIRAGLTIAMVSSVISVANANLKEINFTLSAEVPSKYFSPSKPFTAKIIGEKQRMATDYLANGQPNFHGLTVELNGGNDDITARSGNGFSFITLEREKGPSKEGIRRLILNTYVIIEGRAVRFGHSSQMPSVVAKAEDLKAGASKIVEFRAISPNDSIAVPGTYKGSFSIIFDAVPPKTDMV